MTVLKALGFALGTWIAVVWVFGYSSYHKFFWKNLPLLLIVAAADAWVFVELGFGYRWLVFVILYVIGIVLVAQKQKRTLETLLASTTDADQSKQIAVSGANTLTYFWLSAIVFLIVWFGIYAIVFNSTL